MSTTLFLLAAGLGGIALGAAAARALAVPAHQPAPATANACGQACTGRPGSGAADNVAALYALARTARWSCAADGQRLRGDPLLGALFGVQGAWPERWADWAVLAAASDAPGLAALPGRAIAAKAPVTLRCQMAEGARPLALCAASDGRGGVMGLAVDLTALSAAEAEAAKSAGRLAEFMTELPGAVFVYTLLPDGRDEIAYVSQGCAALWELTGEELAGNPNALWAMIHEDDLPGVQSSVVESAHALSDWCHRFRITTPNGRVKELLGQGRPARLEDGSVRWHTLVLDLNAIRNPCSSAATG